jgi:hypothetical protein
MGLDINMSLQYSGEERSGASMFLQGMTSESDVSLKTIY